MIKIKEKRQDLVYNELVEIKIEANKIEISKRIAKKIRKMTKGWDRQLKGFDEAIKRGTLKIEQGSKSEGWIVSFNMWLPEKHQVFSKAKNEDLMVVLGELEDQVSRQIKKYKSEIYGEKN